MRGHAFRWFFVAAGLLLLGIPLSGQTGMESETTSPQRASDQLTHLGYPQDWSSRHLLMSGVRVEDVLAAGAHDPRYVYSMVKRQVALEKARQAAEDLRIGIWAPERPLRSSRRMKIDWAVSLESGYVPQKQFPAKYQFGVTAENCSADYVLFGLTVATGTFTQANLVGINNLYTAMTPTPCNSGTPLVAFAYYTQTQTGGQIATSPTLSENGKMVAFVESTSAGSYFHVLVLPYPVPGTLGTAVGTVLVPKKPTVCTTPTTVSCMTTLLIENTATNSNSSPWVDYNTDTAYVGADNGLLYKITPVFGGGQPALVTTGGWPASVSTNKYNTVLTDPIVDDFSGLIFLGDGEGYLYSVNMANPATIATQTIGWVYDGSTDGSGLAGTGVVDAPIVVSDVATGTHQVFAFTGCSIVQGIGGAVTQLPTNFATGSASTTNTVNLGSATGIGDCTGANLHSGTVDNAFWLYGTSSVAGQQGHMITCGFVNSGGKPAEPEMYMFPFASNVITAAGDFTFLIDTTKGDECSPLTEFYNGTTDLMFFGVGGTTDGYLESSTIEEGTTPPSLTTPVCTGAPTSTCVTAPSALQGTSGIVIDNQLSNGGTNIYFTTQAVGDVSGQKCHAVTGIANPYCAVRLTQAALQ